METVKQIRGGNKFRNFQPVIEKADGSRILHGVAAVVDKDLASAVLAGEIAADMLVIATAVEKVCLNFGKPNQRALDSMTVTEAGRFIAEGHFAPGSMLSKIEACVQFVTNSGREALITCPEALPDALKGRTGTRLVP